MQLRGAEARAESAGTRGRSVELTLFVLAAIAFIWAIAGSSWLEPHLSSNADEHVYLQQADLLAHGHLLVSVPAGALARSFQPWFAVGTRHGFLFKYNPAWSAALAVGVALGMPRLVLGVVAALFVFGVYFLASAVCATPRRALIATAIVVVSPLTVILSTTFLPYIFFGAIWTFAAGLLVRGAREKRRWQLAVAGGLGSIALCFRPYDTLLVLGPFVLWAFWQLRRDRPAAWRGGGAFLAAATPILVLQAAYNDVFTGSLTRFPFALWSPTDRLGFGLRGLDPGGVPQLAFHLRQGIAGVLANVGQLDEWAYGGFVLMGVALAGLVLVRRRPAVWAVAAVGAALPLGYVFFWGVANGGKLWDSFGRFGPFYFLPALVPLAIFAAEAIVTIWASRPRIVLCAVIVMTLIGGVGAVTAVSASVTERNARQQPYDLIANRLGGSSKALVLLPGYYVGNTLPGMYSLSVDSRTRVLYAVSQGNVDVDLVQRYKDHVPYRLVGCDYSVRGVLGTRRLPTGTDAPFPRVDGKGARLERLKVWHGSTVHLELTVPPTAHAHAMLTVVADGRPISMRLPLDPDHPTHASIALTTRRISLERVGKRKTEPIDRDSLGNAPLAVTMQLQPSNRRVPATTLEWDAPLRVSRHTLTMLEPLRATRVQLETQQEWTVDLCRPDHHARLVVATPGAGT